MTFLRAFRFGGSVLLAMMVFAPGYASECVNIGEWNDLVSTVRPATGTLMLCKFDIDKTASSERLLLNKRLNISCFGATETEKCTIRGPGYHFHIAGSTTEVVLDGFAFHGASECAVRVLSSAKKTQVLQNCDFFKNEGNWSRRGGAIKTELETRLVVSACKFIGNKAGSGGAIFHRGDFLAIFESSFRDNVAKGGAIMGDSLAFFEVHDSSFLNNTAIRLGGAIRVRDPLTLTEITNVVGQRNVPCNGVHDTTGFCDEFAKATPGPAPPESLITTFCVVADAPYDETMRLRLLKQVENIDEDCEFVVHLGDIRSAANFDTCELEPYTNARLIMSRSAKPVFVTLGDNDWNDCPNHHKALAYWHETFDGFLEDNWPTHGFNISSQPGRSENVCFLHKRTLFIMLNIVGGRVHNRTEWNRRLTGNFNWTRDLIETHVLNEQNANAVVIMAHATNSPDNTKFFHPMRDYLQNELGNTIPILHLNGDTHIWKYEPNYFGQPSWLRITLEGEAREPPLKVMVDGSFSVNTVQEAFSYDRGL